MSDEFKTAERVKDALQDDHDSHLSSQADGSPPEAAAGPFLSVFISLF